MSEATAGKEQDTLIGVDELEEQQACQQFALSSEQLVGLHARRLGWYDSRKLGVSYECARLYKTADVEDLSKQLIQQKKSGNRRRTSTATTAIEEEWYEHAHTANLSWQPLKDFVVQLAQLTVTIGRDLEDTGGGGKHEIDEYKASEHFKLSADRLDRLPYRHLSWEESKALGRRRGRVRAYRLQDVCQLVTDLQNRVNEQHESAVDRREQMQDASKAKAFEAASKAKALVKTWKKPRLSPCQTCLPMELWGLVLQQLLPEACLWDLPAAAQQLCNISLTSKGLYAAVQQQGWPQLCQLLKALPPPAAMQRSKYQAPHDSKGQLPSTPDVVITDPASLCLPELRAACNYLGLYTSGIKAEVMVRILEHFRLSHPCSAPMQVVAYSSIHAAVVQFAMSKIYAIANSYPKIHGQPHPLITAGHASLCDQLSTPAILDIGGIDGRWCYDVDACMPAEVLQVLRRHVAAAAPHLQKMFATFSSFLHMAGCEKTYEDLCF